jgi:hypothetical protein
MCGRFTLRASRAEVQQVLRLDEVRTGCRCVL